MLDISFDMVREAIAVFLSCAYPSGKLPEVVRRRIGLDGTRPVAELLNGPPFERYVAEAPFHCTVYALRLGSADYPHLKMEIRPFPNRCGFVFWVNTHDQFFTPDEQYAEADRWRQLLQRNRELKQAIERAWAVRKLPTFTTAMQESLNPAEPPWVTESIPRP